MSQRLTEPKKWIRSLMLIYIKGVFEKSKTMNESTFFDDQIRETKAKHVYRLKSGKGERAKAESELSK